MFVNIVYGWAKYWTISLSLLKSPFYFNLIHLFYVCSLLFHIWIFFQHSPKAPKIHLLFQHVMKAILITYQFYLFFLGNSPPWALWLPTLFCLYSTDLSLSSWACIPINLLLDLLFHTFTHTFPPFSLLLAAIQSQSQCYIF